ncbi:hypothetical protein V6N13_042509 [Hibiscus sabdariffa]
MKKKLLKWSNIDFSALYVKCGDLVGSLLRVFRDIVQVSFLVMERGPSWLLSEIDVLDDCSFEGDIKSLRSYNNRRETFLGMTWSIELKGASAA